MLLCLSAAVAAGVSCNPENCECPFQSGEETGPDGEDTGKEPEEKPEDQTKIPVFNIALASYPEEYDWLRDPDYGIIECYIKLLRDGEEILSFAAGHSYGISAYIGRVHCTGSHVYTDYTISSETIIGKDGKELFRYSGNEMIEEFAADGETCIYTLGIPEDGEGWIFRKNGAIVASSSSGRIIPGFRLDGGVPVFACAEYAEYVTGTVPEYYLVRDGEMSAISPGSPQESFYSVMSVNGTVYALSSDPDSGKAYFHEGDDRTELSYSGNGSIVPECLLTDGSSVYALAGVPEYGDDGSAREILWKDGEVLVAFEESFKVLACYPEEDRVLAVGYYGDDWGSQFMFLDGEYLPFPENYGLAAVSAGIMTAGHYCLCLNPFEISMPPLCILDGEIVEIDANGCFLGVGHTWEYVTDADAGHDDSSENV